MTSVMVLARVIIVVAAAGLMLTNGVVAPPVALAQENPGQDWKNLTPDTREKKRQQYFSNLPESQQQKLRQNQRKFQSLSGNQQRTLCQKFHKQHGYLPPACQGLLGP